MVFFQRIAFAAPLANLISVPVFSFATVPLVLASVSLQPVSGSASEALLALAGHSIRLIEAIIAVIAALPYSYREIAGIDGHSRGIVCVVFLPILWVLLPRGFPGRWIAIVAVAALLLHRPAPPPNACVDAHVLDVGQGLAVVVQSHRRTLLFDTGASYRSGGSAAVQVILPFLRHRGVEFIDWLVVSHADNDHAGGVSAMISGIDIGQILTGEPLAGNASGATLCEAGRSWEADSVLFRILYPDANQARDGNNASCVLEISVGSQRLLLTGDIERDAEERLLRDGSLRSASVLLIPHHGSLTSSTPAFVDRVRPQLAVASAGFGNRWGFPKNRVQKRWQGVGADVLDTATSGAVSIRLCANGGIQRMQQERLRRWRFWHTGRPVEYEKSGRFGKNF